MPVIIFYEKKGIKGEIFDQTSLNIIFSDNNSSLSLKRNFDLFMHEIYIYRLWTKNFFVKLSDLLFKIKIGNYDKNHQMY